MGPRRQGARLRAGQTVERRPYDLLFGERKAPDGTQLGRPPGSGRKAADLYAQLLAAEPQATAERKRELRTEAVRKARQSPLFFDLTISFSKSISIFHASPGENARLARQAGDHDGDAYWSALVGEVDDMIWQAVHAGFGYFQREAGYTRTGSHGTRVHRQRALAEWAGAAGSGLIAWGLGTEAPTRAEVDKNIQQNRDLLRKLGKLGPEAPATAGTPALTAASDRDTPGTTLLSRSWGWSSRCGMACATRGG